MLYKDEKNLSTVCVRVSERTAHDNLDISFSNIAVVLIRSLTTVKETMKKCPVLFLVISNEKQTAIFLSSHLTSKCMSRSISQIFQQIAPVFS